MEPKVFYSTDTDELVANCDKLSCLRAGLQDPGRTKERLMEV